MQLSEILKPACVRVASNFSSKKRLLQEVADLAASGWGVDAAEAVNALLERENLGPTGVGHGVALPHARLEGLDRVVRRGGTAFVIDNDPTRSAFGGWFRRGFPEVDPDAVERFWSTRGWRRRGIDMGWSFDSRADLEAVVRIELPTKVAEEVLATHTGTTVDYAVNLWWRHY